LAGEAIAKRLLGRLAGMDEIEELTAPDPGEQKSDRH
jgi:hypothetical protein